MGEKGLFVKFIIRWRPLALFGIVLLGLLLRLYGLNWDAGNSFHPDERQIMFHVTVLSWPKSMAQFLDPVNSPLNPHFFAYGSFPLYLLASLGNFLVHFSPSLGSFTNLTLVGRVLSALFDSGTILFTGLLGLKLMYDTTPGKRHAWNVALLAAALVAFTPLQLQLSHFYAVDTILLFFVTLTVYACVHLIDTEQPIRWALFVGLGYGLALATKFSATPLAVSLLVAVILRWRKQDFFTSLTSLLIATFFTILVFLIAEPYALLDMPNFIQQISDQGNLARGLLDLPYVRQFAGTVPYLYEAQNMFFWGMGVFLGFAVCVGFGWVCFQLWRQREGAFIGWLVVLSWIFTYGIITGDFYVKFMRYMLPLYPFLSLLAAVPLIAFARFAWTRESTTIEDTKPSSQRRRDTILQALSVSAIVLVFGGTLFQGLALLNVYSQPNTRIQASRWMYSHLQPHTTLTYEQWDDPLPIAVDQHDPSEFTQTVYTNVYGQPTTGLDLYGNDTMAKAQLLAHLLPKIDVITMPTDRLDKSIPRLPDRYPLTIHYYQLLFSGQLGFHLAAKFENHPNLLGITLNDSNADESYSVFDHPTARIFVRDNPYPYTSEQLLQKLLVGIKLS
ncbi:MAG: hypothetical protein NVS2B2_09980 [Ktedonobacteraceae bacterium]